MIFNHSSSCFFSSEFCRYHMHDQAVRPSKTPTYTSVVSQRTTPSKSWTDFSPRLVGLYAQDFFMIMKMASLRHCLIQTASVSLLSLFASCSRVKWRQSLRFSHQELVQIDGQPFGLLFDQSVLVYIVQICICNFISSYTSLAIY